VLISRGNHKSAIKYTEELYKTEKEVAQGRVVPLPLDYISSLKNGELAPVGMGYWVESQTLRQHTEEYHFMETLQKSVQ